MTTVLAVDGNALGHRAWHARDRGAEAPSGHWVTHRVMGMLSTAWTEGPFDTVVIAFDSETNQRKAAYPEYKANRPETDPDLRDHLQRLRDHLAECGFHVRETHGAEGDDVLAAAADECRRAGWRCGILSADRDLLALVDDKVVMLRPRGTISDLRVYDRARVLAEYGVEPPRYRDLAALRGDPSDGLAGVHGIGPKIAARLVNRYGTIQEIYQSLIYLPPKLEAALRKGRDRVERNMELMRPLDGVDADVTAAVDAGIDVDQVVDALVDLGLGAAAGRFRNAYDRPALPPLPPPPDDADAPEAQDPAHDAPAAARVPVSIGAHSSAPPPGVGEQVTLF